jgi:hypothetical protein
VSNYKTPTFKMKKYITYIILFTSLPLYSQYKTVTYDDGKNWFNESQPLPAESNWMLSGDLPSFTKMTTLDIFKTDNIERSPLYSTQWKIAIDGSTQKFVMPVNYNLRGNDSYTFVISYYKPVTLNEKIKLQQLLNDGIDAYISQSITATNKSVQLRKHPKLILQDLDKLVDDGIELYSSANNLEFKGFSVLVLDKIKQIDELNLKKARFNILNKEDDSKRNIKIQYLDKHLTELKALCKKELAQYIGSELLVLFDRRIVVDYPTEKVKNILPINIGYAGIYDSGSLNNLTYSTSPYAGISFPLGKKAFAGQFWSNTSISAGVLLNNIDLGTDKNVTGPLVGRPIMIGLGYKTFYFLRLNAGATILQSEKNKATDLSKVFIRPYVGLSIEINLWLGLER